MRLSQTRATRIGELCVDRSDRRAITSLTSLLDVYRWRRRHSATIVAFGGFDSTGGEVVGLEEVRHEKPPEGEARSCRVGELVIVEEVA